MAIPKTPAVTRTPPSIQNTPAQPIASKANIQNSQQPANSNRASKSAKDHSVGNSTPLQARAVSTHQPAQSTERFALLCSDMAHAQSAQEVGIISQKIESSLPDGLLHDDKFNALSQVVVESAPSAPSHQAAVTLLEKVAEKAEIPSQPSTDTSINQKTARAATLQQVAQERSNKPDLELGQIAKGTDSRRAAGEVYRRDVFEASMDGREVIAAYYNKKYFENTDSKIVVAKSPADLNDKIESAIKEASNHKRPVKLGITLSADQTNPFYHSVSLILERTADEKWKLFVADGSSSALSFVDALEMELPEAVGKHDIEVLCPATGRQNSVGHCHTESLVFLKNALLLPGSVSSYTHEVTAEQLILECPDKQKPHVQNYISGASFGKPEAPEVKNAIKNLHEYYPGVNKFFYYKPELLKTEQSTSRFEAVNPNAQETLLPNTKGKTTIGQFFKKHKGEATYKKSSANNPNALTEDLVVPENAYLHRKTEEHKRLLEEYKEIKNQNKQG